ncbi:hypothetical protein [Chryseobacterium wanjuense]
MGNSQWNSGQLTANGSTANLAAGNSEDVNLAFSTVYTIASGVINKADYSATINVPNGTGLTTAGDYFLMLGGTAGASVTFSSEDCILKEALQGIH